MKSATYLAVVEGTQEPEILFEVPEARPLIPDAIYTAECTGCDVKEVYGTLKAFFHFTITEGGHAGTALFRPYRLDGKVLPGKGPGSGPRPRLNRDGDLFKMLCRVIPGAATRKAYRLSHRELIGRLCEISTRTVTRDSKRRERPEPYSVVFEVLSLK